MGRTRIGTQTEAGMREVTLASGAVGSTAVAFRQPFTSAPEVLVVHHLGDEAATITVASITDTGFSFSITGSAIPDGKANFEWFAHGKT